MMEDEILPTIKQQYPQVLRYTEALEESFVIFMNRHLFRIDDSRPTALIPNAFLDGLTLWFSAHLHGSKMSVMNGYSAFMTAVENKAALSFFVDLLSTRPDFKDLPELFPRQLTHLRDNSRESIDYSLSRSNAG